MKLLKKFSAAILTIVIILLTCFNKPMEVSASTIYKSDGIEYDEGYIFVGESHCVYTSGSFALHSNAYGDVEGLKGIRYKRELTRELDVDENGEPNTFVMTGNLFFVFQGNKYDDVETQIGKDCIFSDGKGNYGIAVEKVHSIIDSNPNIKHWNIISSQGSIQSVFGKEMADYYVSCYKNWIKYEFPQADIYIMSHATMTKFYRGLPNIDVFDKTLQKAFPTRFLDYTAYYKQNYPSGMLEPAEKADTIHWNNEVYFKIYSDVIKRIQQGKIKTGGFPLE